MIIDRQVWLAIAGVAPGDMDTIEIRNQSKW